MINHLTHQFVKSFPNELESGVLYASFEYDTTIHLCACGCGNQVVLPLDPTGWKLTYDGRTVSMWPSVGNWSFPCQSHYVIARGRVDPAPTWSYQQIVAGRQRTLRERGLDIDTGTGLRHGNPPTVWRRVKDLVKQVVRRA